VEPHTKPPLSIGTASQTISDRDLKESRHYGETIADFGRKIVASSVLEESRRG
jgi:hypothetical protein